MDCRSYKGFSGSPVFSTLSYAVLRETNNLPPVARLSDETGELPLGSISHAASFAGVFTAHFSDEESAEGVVSRYGIGVMVPCDYVREILMDDHLAKGREEADQELKEQEAAEQPPLEEASMGESEFGRFENLTRKLVQTPKPDKS